MLEWGFNMSDVMGFNLPERSVSELSQDIKAMMEDGFSYLRVRGEVGRVSRPSSGHLYFDLKEGPAVLSAVCWRSNVARLAEQPVEGQEMILTGRLTTFPGQSRYQLLVDSVEIAGRGALMAALEALRAKLQGEGLFDPEHKRPLPFMPARVGVVTSPSGSVLRDIIHRMRDRFATPITLWPSRVQGDGAGRELTHAIRGLSRMVEDGHELAPDVVILARGGGSFEDLFCFNDEELVRAVAACPVPVVSAVGHETDVTLVDFAADLRAPTPSAAAELVFPLGEALAKDLSRASARMDRLLQQRVHQMEQRLDYAERFLRGGAQRLAQAQTRLQQATRRLDRAPGQSSRNAAQRLALAGKRLTPGRLLERHNSWSRHVVALGRRGDQEIQRRVHDAGERLVHLARMMEVMSHRNVLARGYMIARNEKGDVVTLSQIEGPSFWLEDAGGRAEATIIKKA